MLLALRIAFAGDQVPQLEQVAVGQAVELEGLERVHGNAREDVPHPEQGVARQDGVRYATENHTGSE